jgi:hypothetical protein
MMPSKQTLKGAAVGAAISTAILVTVFEGKVILANPHGKAELAAGEQASATPDQAPAARAEAIAATEPPSAGASQKELLERDEGQRRELAVLRARVKSLEAQTKARGDGQASPELPDMKDRSWYQPSKEELAALARECKLKWDAPPLGAAPHLWTDKRAKEAGLTDEEREGANKVTTDLHARVLGQLRGLYTEVTGETVVAKELTPSALQEEISAKSPEADVQLAYRRISQERAGLAPAPSAAELARRAPIERMMRLVTSLGDTYERDLAQVLGDKRAHALRADNGGWGSRSMASHGCPE